MKINQIPNENEVKIKIVTVETSTEVDTKIMPLSDMEKKALSKLIKKEGVSFCTMELIKQDGKTLGFSSSSNVLYSISCTIDGKYYTWENVIIKTIKLPSGNLCYLVLSQSDVTPSNRRNAYRLWIGEEVSLTMGLNNNRKKAVLKDLSATGIGLVVTDAEEYKKDKILHVNYVDRDNVTFNLTGKVVNIVELAPGKVLIGCAFLSRSPAVEKYISKKQIERAKEKNK